MADFGATEILAAGSILSGATSVLGALSGGKSSAPAPVVTQPTVMPTPDDEAQKAAKRRALAGQLQRRGRESTILDQGLTSDPLGG